MNMIWAFIITLVLANGQVVNYNKQAYCRHKPIHTEQNCKKEAERLKQVLLNSITFEINSIQNINVVCKKVPINSCFKHSQILMDYHKQLNKSNK